MRIAINGSGVAGPALAWWLIRFGHEPVIFERAPALRTGGYVIDFWGIGYDILEKMGLLERLRERAYAMQRLLLLDDCGKVRSSVDARALAGMTDGRFFTVPRSDVSAILYEGCGKVETRFGTCIQDVKQNDHEAIVTASDGSEESFDLVVGADGLHSHVRRTVFGPQESFERPMGIHVVAFTLDGYPRRDELTYVTYQKPLKQAARLSIRDGRTLFLLTFRSELIDGRPETRAEQMAAVRTAYSDAGWELPEILRRMPDTDDFYFDRVSQIDLPTWSSGRVALLGDAAACISLLGGEGTGLAITEAYVLAGELARSGGNHQAAFREYETRLRKFLRGKQKSARGVASFFAPRNSRQIWLSRLMLRSISIPVLGRLLLGPTFRDHVELPDYEAGMGGR